jgi:hypothetical protein
MTALREHLTARARKGDVLALELVLDALPGEMPARTAIRLRNEYVLAAARWLRAEMIATTNRELARFIADAGDRRRPRSLAKLSRDERAELFAMVEPAVVLCGGWPSFASVRRIIEQNQQATWLKNTP